MSSGAYSVFIDQQAPGGGPTALRRVVALPPHAPQVPRSTPMLEHAPARCCD
jgi:hypothetical protein